MSNQSPKEIEELYYYSNKLLAGSRGSDYAIAILDTILVMKTSFHHDEPVPDNTSYYTRTRYLKKKLEWDADKNEIEGIKLAIKRFDTEYQIWHEAIARLQS